MNRPFASLFALGLVGVVGVGVGVREARGVAVTIFVNDGLNGWQAIASDSSGVFANAPSYTTISGQFSFLDTSASGANGPSAALSSSALSIQHLGAGSDTLLVAIIGTGYTSPTSAPITVTSTVGGGTNQGGLTFLSFQSYVDSTNNGSPQSLSGGLGLQSPAVLFPSVSGPGTALTSTIASNLGSPFSVAELTTLTMSGSGQLTNLGGSTTLTPAPGAALLMGVGVAGLMAARRRVAHP